MAFDAFSGSGATIDSWIRWRAREDSARPFIEAASGVFGFGEFDELVEGIADGLAGIGVQPGDRVAIYMQNSFDYLAAVYGVLRLGAVYVPCSTLAAPDELVFQLEQTSVRAAFVDREHLGTIEEIRSKVASLGVIVVVGDEDASWERGNGATISLKRLRATSERRAPHFHSADDLAMIMYSSGTTARPKGIMYSHGNLLSTAYTAQNVFQWRRDDRFLHFYPMYHMLGGLTGILPAIVTGATIVLRERFTASRFGEMLVTSDATYCNVNSTHVKMILAHPVTEFDHRHLTSRMHLGLSLGIDEIESFERRFATRLCGSYGMTESCGTNMAISPTGPNRPGSAGRVVSGYSAKIVDENGTALGPGEAGELCIATSLRHGLTMGYWKDPVLTSELFRDGWMHTGDVGFFDEDGYFWFGERKKDVIKRSGFNVAPAEVERVIREVAGVRDVAVVGTPDPFREEAIVAFVVSETEDAVSIDSILEACRASLSEYKVPQAVNLVDHLPVNFLGKLERATLREWALERR